MTGRCCSWLLSGEDGKTGRREISVRRWVGNGEGKVETCLCLGTEVY